MNLPLTSIRLRPLTAEARSHPWRAAAQYGRPDHTLIWLTRGQGRISVGGVRRGLGTHHAVFVPAGTMLGLEPGAQSYGTVLSLPPWTSAGLPRAPLHLRVLDAQTAAELTGILDNISRELLELRPGCARACEAWCSLLSVWLERRHEAEQETAPPAPPSPAEELTARYAALVESHFYTGAGPSDLAGRLGVTPTHLTRCCNKAAGMTASALLSQRTIFAACERLAHTDLPAAQIAAQLGYGSAAYFTRAFSAAKGMSPTAFRRRFGREDAGAALTA